MIGMPAALALASEPLIASAFGTRHREAVDLLRDGGVDQLRLLLRVVVGRAPDELDALVLGRLLGALLDDRPERALVAVGDHRERQAAALGQVDVCAAAAVDDRGCRCASLLPPPQPATSAASASDGDEQRRRESLHRWDTSLLGAQVDRNSMLARDIERRTARRPGAPCPVMAMSCSSTSQRSYPVWSRRRTTSSIRASPCPSGRNSPACVACDERQLAARARAPPARASTSLRWTWPMRSAWSRTKATGSTPPISRWPVSKHQRHVGVRERALDVGGGLDQRADVRVQDELEALRRRRASASSRRCAPQRAASRRRRASTGADQSSVGDERGDEHARRRPRRAGRGAPRRARACRRASASCTTSGTKPPTSRSPWRVERARGAARRRAAASPGGRARWRAGPARPSRRARARAAAAGPSRGPRRRPMRSGRRASRRSTSAASRSTLSASASRAPPLERSNGGP